VRPPPIPRLTRQVPSTPQQQGAVEFAEPTSSSPADMGCCAPPTALVARPLPVGGHPSSATPHVLSCRLTRHFGVGTGHHHRAGSRCSHRQVENFARPLQSCFLRVVPFGRAWSPGWRWPAWPRLYGVILSAETVVRAMSPGGGESQHLLLAEVGYEAVRCKTERLLRPERRRRRPWTALDGQERPAPKANPATYAALNGKPPARPGINARRLCPLAPLTWLQLGARRRQRDACTRSHIPRTGPQLGFRRASAEEGPRPCPAVRPSSSL